jgi:hypothetical protein
MIKSTDQRSLFKIEHGCFYFAMGTLTLRGGQSATLFPRLNETLAAQLFQPDPHDATAVQVEQHLHPR